MSLPFDGIQKKDARKPLVKKTVIRVRTKPQTAFKKVAGHARFSRLVRAPRVATYVVTPWYSQVLRYYAPRGFVALVATLAFLSGAWIVWRTDHTEAQEQQAVVSEQAIGEPVLEVSEVPVQSVERISNEVLFNLSLEQLEQYLSEVTKMPAEREAEILAARKEKLTTYLREKKSPFVDYVDTLVVQKHWKLILAISNAESSLGKRCHSNNCSGIGVEPGHPAWREYDTLADWMVSLNRLLERRYKDWTLEKMNGVYVQPGSKNWLMATKQILDELEERGIQ